MPYLTINGKDGKRLAYAVEGEGFPLILVPALDGLVSDWAPQMPLLGELCRTLAYAYDGQVNVACATVPIQLPARVQDLEILLGYVDIERAYLAGYADGGFVALQMALSSPKRVEGLLLIGVDMARPEDHLDALTVPTCVFVGEMADNHVNCSAQLAARVPHVAQCIISEAATAPHREQPLRLAHAMLDFLIQCERQRNLVRGASFLL
ncbi:MAG: hypothetical protein O7G88_18790 [bacterium]|nr:hypothetical protein [bacterium]